MAGCCSDHHCGSEAKGLNSPAWRRALWIALAVNGGFFLAEIVRGPRCRIVGAAGRRARFPRRCGELRHQPGRGRDGAAWRARAALVKGGTLIVFALWVLGSTAWHALHGTLPQAEVMGMVGVAALIANGGVALMLYRFRSGDANMRSVWICSRNDAIGNVAVLLAALGVFGTGTGWPDIIVAAIMAGLGLWGGGQIVRQAMGELDSVSVPLSDGVAAVTERS